MELSLRQLGYAKEALFLKIWDKSLYVCEHLKAQDIPFYRDEAWCFLFECQKKGNIGRNRSILLKHLVGIEPEALALEYNLSVARVNQIANQLLSVCRTHIEDVMKLNQS